MQASNQDDSGDDAEEYKAGDPEEGMIVEEDHSI